MTEDAKKASDAAEEATTTETADEETEEAKATDVDYKAELEKLKGHYSKAVGALHDERDRRKAAEKQAKTTSSSEEKDTSKEEDEDVEDEKLDPVAAKVLATVEKRQRESALEELVGGLTANPDEQELIKTIYETRINRTGSTREAMTRDLLDAQLLANRSRFMENAEKKAKKSVAQATAIRMAGAKIQAKAQEEDAPEYTPEERRFLKKYGVDA